MPSPSSLPEVRTCCNFYRQLEKEKQITQFELRDAQLELRKARTNLKKALHDYNVAVATVEKAVGYDVRKLNVLAKDKNEGEGK